MRMNLPSVPGAALCVLALALPAGAAAQQPPDTSSAPVVDALVRDLCGKRVALLGESPTHGSGKAVQLKVAVTMRLVDQCHYRAFFIESGAYDFLNIQRALRSRGQVTEAMISAAIGGIWANQEMQPLVPFLLERARRGTLLLGGLDDQLSRGSWAQGELAAELASRLRGADSARCLGVLQRHVQYEYSDSAPYDRATQARILACLGRVEAALRADHAPRGAQTAREVDPQMAANLRRLVLRDFPADTSDGLDAASRAFNARDRSMYENFRFLLARLPRGAKVIVWCANNHAAKELRTVPGLERRVPLGSYIHRAFGDAAFAAATTAYAGSYALGRHPAQTWPPAPAGSLESRTMQGDDVPARYLPAGWLREFGPVPSRVLGTAFITASWSDVVDGVVVFREDAPPHPLP